MRRLRKYLVFWILVLGAFVPFAAPLGDWVRPQLESLAPAPAAAAPAEPSNPEESLALTLEDHFEMVDVVNIDHSLNDAGDPVMVIQMSISSPVGASIYERLLTESLQGLDGLKMGDEKHYLIEFLYGYWLVGRLQCSSADYRGGALNPDLCDYSDITPAAYMGDTVRWPGRSADVLGSQ